MMTSLSKHGYSLVEALLSMAILVFVLLCAYGVLTTGNAIMVNDNALVEMQQQARNAVDRIVRDVRESTSQAVVVLGANSDRLTFSTPAAANVMYYLSGTNLVREFPSGTLVNIASNIARLKFTLNGTVLTIDVRADRSLYSKTISFPLVVKVMLRNE